MRILARAVTAAVSGGIVVSGAAAVAAPGGPDPTFSGDGRAPIDGLVLVSDLKVDQLGRTLVLGQIDGNRSVARLTPRGVLDSTFGTGGLVAGAFGNALAVDDANRVYVSLESNNGPARVVRLTTGGSADPTWGGKDGDPPGLAAVDAAGGDPQIAGDMVVDGSGRLVLTISSSSPNTDFLVARLDPDGDEDDTFDTNGIQGTDFGEGDSAFSLAIGPGNRVVVAGRAEVAGIDHGAISVFTENGADDTAFTGDGFEVFTDLPTFQDVAIGPRGDYLVNGAEDKTVLAAFKPNGQPDPKFSGDGLIERPLVPNCLFCRSSVNYDPVRKRIYWFYPYVDGPEFVRILSRHKPDGRIDKTFKPRNPAGSIEGQAIAVEPRSGRLLAVVGLQGSLGVARFETWPRCGGKVPVLVGGPGGETLKGISRKDVISGGGGRDIIKGRGGNDRLCGEAGRDTLRGGAGKDRLFGGAGKDVLRGGPGRDRLVQ